MSKVTVTKGNVAEVVGATLSEGFLVTSCIVLMTRRLLVSGSWTVSIILRRIHTSLV